MNSDKVAELRDLMASDHESDWIVNLWTKYNNDRAGKVAEWAELEKYLFATDTTSTANATAPWTHTATNPKLTNIRDNLHANYMSALFPNDKWLTWQGFTEDAAKKDTADVIQGYMENKTRMGGFRDTVEKLLNDYIDYGNSFAQPTFEERYHVVDEAKKVSFVGPKAVRISPVDIVFNPTASSFDTTYKIIRSTTTVGAIKKLQETDPSSAGWGEFLRRRELIRNVATGYSYEDWKKAEAYSFDGFGNLRDYYSSESVEVLEFYGDYYDNQKGELVTGVMMTVADRSQLVRTIPIPTYSGEAAIRQVGWRERQDNLWAMGPMDNLVGLQYLIDHYQNMLANALDLKVMPPKKIIGEVEEFEWGPNETIHIDEGGDVQEMAQQFGDLAALQSTIEQLEARMELYAGAPREAMGIRSPGEKTAFEVQTLDNASGRIFQAKITKFELFLEELLNDMLEIAHRNMGRNPDTISIIDDDLGAMQFRSITKEDITADGKIRPVGARHFSQKANELQNLIGIFSSPLAEKINPHTSAIQITKFVEDVVDLRGYNIFKPNIAVDEAKETNALSEQAMEDNEMVAGMSEEELMATEGANSE